MEHSEGKFDTREEILREICYSNGLKYDKLNQEGLSCTSLEMYFTGLPKFPGLDKFPNLKQLCVVGQPIKHIENLKTLDKLVELWIAECNIQEIVELEECKNLKKLYLYLNKISTVQNLEGLKYLTVLHLNNNKIHSIEGLRGLVNLKELNLAENLIEHIGQSLNGLNNLESLELSGNPLFILQDLKNLMCLKKLEFLYFKSFLYKPCPLTYLSNYSFYVVHHFPMLRNLDEENVDLQSIKTTAEIVVEKKMRYYTMKQQLVQSYLFDTLQRIDAACLRRVKCFLAEISEKEEILLRISHDLISHENGIALMHEISECYSQLGRQEQEKENLMKEFQERAWTKLGYLQLELETVGNVTITIGNPSYPWFNTCSKLVMSRFCGSNCPDQFGSKISVTQIARIENMITSQRFNYNVNSSLHQGDNSYRPLKGSNSTSKNSDYLFHVWDEDLHWSNDELMEILSVGARGGICHLSNSIHIANAARFPAKSGRLVLSRVFLGKSAPFDGHASPTEKNFSKGINSLFQTLCSRQEGSLKLLRCTSDSPMPDESSHVSLCDCADKQMHWYIRRSAHVCPEYVIEFDYINSKSEPSDSLEERLIRFTSSIEDKTLPVFSLGETKFSSNKSVSNLIDEVDDFVGTDLDLSCEELTNLEGIVRFSSLVRLVISHNGLNTLNGISSLCSLQELDVSHNRLHCLYCLESMFSLKILDVNFNNLSALYENLYVLKNHATNLVKLNFSYNPWQKAQKIKQTALDMLPQLKIMDDEPVEILACQVQSRKILCSCRESKSRGLNISGWNCSQVCERNPNEGEEEVTAINMSNGILVDLSDLAQFCRLRTALLDNNNIICLKGLKNSCETLTNLSLSNNHLTDISCLSSAVNLVRLSLDSNNLDFVRPLTFEKHLHLQVLSINNNLIESLEFLTPLGGLMEFYASYNSVGNLREIFFLKKMNSLMIVDLHGNPMCGEDNYRLFTIFHLGFLKILDGVFIDPSELTSAKETFGGLLTLDFLADQLSTVNFSNIKVLDFPQFSIQTIDLGNPSMFSNLISINLEHNNLSSFCGLTHLSKLKTLCLNYNRIEGLQRAKGKKVTGFGSSPRFFAYQREVFPSLEVLHLGYNGLRDLTTLHLNLFPSLRALFLQGNEITLINGLEGCSSLEELVLDRNRIRFVNESSFSGLLRLSELHLEENRLRSLSNFSCLFSIQRLFLGMNHLQDICDIDKLNPLTRLVEISLIQNNLAKRNTHRLVLLHHLPSLQVIDGSQVTDIDWARSDTYYLEQMQFNPNVPHVNQEMPGLTNSCFGQGKHTSKCSRITEFTSQDVKTTEEYNE